MSAFLRSKRLELGVVERTFNPSTERRGPMTVTSFRACQGCTVRACLRKTKGLELQALGAKPRCPESALATEPPLHLLESCF